MRYRLRTLLIVLAVAPVLLAVGWWIADALTKDDLLPPGYYIGEGIRLERPLGSEFKLGEAANEGPR
jgi:hypothetical protein